MSGNATRKTQARYNRIAPIYDLMETIVERVAFRRWRRDLWTRVGGERILEVGVGTGKNVPYHPPGAQVIAIDISDGMLEQAAERARGLEVDLSLVLMDAQHLGLPDDAFDAAVATFVFCSVPDPVRGLKEIGRVLKPGGRALLLEHVRVDVPIVGAIMDLLDPIVLRLIGPHINRRTVKNVKRAGLKIEQVNQLVMGGLVKTIVARSESRRH